MISMQRKAMHRKKDFDRFKTCLYSLPKVDRADTSSKILNTPAYTHPAKIKTLEEYIRD